VRRIDLADGSVMFLDSDSIAQIRFGDRQRQVVVRKGTALFQVATDPLHPFRVTAGDIAATVLGTVFSVRLSEEGMAVTVAEGAVRVDDTAHSGPSQTIRSNEQFVSAGSGNRRTSLPSEEVARRLAWKERRLVFDGQQLGAAAREVSRYTRTPVFIDDAKLARAEFFGIFNVGDGQAFVAAAAAAFDGKVVEEADGLHIQRSQNAPSH
jgi:transmembrane sensor